MFFERGEDATIADIERRLSEWSLIPVGHGEGMQVAAGCLAARLLLLCLLALAPLPCLPGSPPARLLRLCLPAASALPCSPAS